MTPKEAIEMIRNDMRIHHDYLSGQYRKALNMAISALEKQIPKKPIRDGEWSPILCPTCGAWLSKHHGDGYYTCNEPEYCYNDECHQLLDWEEDDD